MYPILILRSEVVCLIVLVFLRFASHVYQIQKENRAFTRLIWFAILHVIFDITTVLTVNHLETVPTWANFAAHAVFYLTAILFANEVTNYAIALVYPMKARKLYRIGIILILLYICSLPFLKIEYVADVGTNSSAGLAAYIGYGLGFTYFLIGLCVLFKHFKKLPSAVKGALIPMMLVLIVIEVCQIIWRSVLFTGGGVTIVTVGFFFSLENPVEVFKKKAMTDALTGVRSRASYEEEIEKLNKRFRENPNGDYIFVFCDLNGLRTVNNSFGHAEGDNFITLIASAINRCMKHSASFYRIGGDEFLILYYKTDEETVKREIDDLQATCVRDSEGLPYTASISVGYARSSTDSESLHEVVKAADFSMYQRKTGRTQQDTLGTSLNYAGLTDRMFDILCAANDRNYPFITNLDTNVTRISPEWKDYFGLDNEFYIDFNSVWLERVHPDFTRGFLDDIVAVTSGFRKFHNYSYFAKKADGEYVRVSCHGSIYRDNSTGTTFFGGFMTNHGVDTHTDPVTGVPDFDSLTATVCAHMDAEKPFSILKLKINNFSHVNMLYGYEEGSQVLRKFAAILTAGVEGRGAVFCQNSIDFTLLFEGKDENAVKEFYDRIFALCATGIPIEKGAVPVQLSGGAYINPGKKTGIEQIRGGLVYAVEESLYNRRNALVFYRDINEDKTETDISLLARIHTDALGDMQYFQLRYQPITDIATRKTVGAEALLRWIHPVFGEVPPGQFIAFLETDPCYYRLGLGIFDRAVKDAKEFRKKIPDFRVNVNITALQLQNEHFADNVCEILEKYDFPADGLILELTERCKEMDSQFLAKKIAGLRSRGLLVAFDDLGTGYSTISLLMDIPVDEIKLDRAFVSDLANRETYQVFVRSLILGSNASHYTICFEGIEDEETLGLVGSFGNYLAQGYYFSKPLLLNEFNEYINKELLATDIVVQK